MRYKKLHRPSGENFCPRMELPLERMIEYGNLLAFTALGMERTEQKRWSEKWYEALEEYREKS